MANTIRRCLHFSSSVSISIASNTISIVQSSKVSVSGERGKTADSVQKMDMDMDVDTDSSSVVITAGTSLELADKDEKKEGARFVFIFF